MVIVDFWIALALAGMGSQVALGRLAWQALRDGVQGRQRRVASEHFRSSLFRLGSLTGYFGLGVFFLTLPPAPLTASGLAFSVVFLLAELSLCINGYDALFTRLALRSGT